MKEPHDHHFAPQGFLRQWSNDKGQVWRTRINPYNGEFETRIQRSTKSIAWKKDLYNIDNKFRTSPIILAAVEFMKNSYGITDSIHLNLETSVFQKVDNDGINAYRKVLEDEDFRNLSQIDIVAFFRFAYLLQARNPVNLKRMTDSWIKDVLPQFENALLGTPYDIADMSSDDNASKLALLDIALDPNIGRELYENIRMFFFKINSSELSFTTSDYPYVALPDIGNQNALHIMPLSPKLCLIMSADEKLILGIRDRFSNQNKVTEAVKLINFIVGSYSSEVFSNTELIPSDTKDYLSLYTLDIEKAKSMFHTKMLDTI